MICPGCGNNVYFWKTDEEDEWFCHVCHTTYSERKILDHQSSVTKVGIDE